MDIKLNTPVETTDGTVGHVARLILDPVKDKLSHIVVKHHGTEREIPVSYILSTDENSVKLDCTKEFFDQQPNFVEVEYIREPQEHAEAVDFYGIYYHPYVTMETYKVKHEHIPVGEVSFTRSTPVLADGGHIGKIDELVVDPVNYHITHIVLREGHLWGQRDVVIGVEYIELIDDKGIHLNITRQEVEALPELPIHRQFGVKVSP